MDNTSFIQEIRHYIDNCYVLFPSYLPVFRDRVRDAVAQRTASADQQAQLEALEKELAGLRPPLDLSFLGSTAVSR